MTSVSGFLYTRLMFSWSYGLARNLLWVERMRNPLALCFLALLLSLGCSTDADSGDGQGAADAGAAGGADAGECPRFGQACPDFLEACGFADRGWDLACEDGISTIDDLTAVMCCKPEETEPYCEVEYGSETFQCPGSCIEEGWELWVETLDELPTIEAACSE